jgi:hypothetical protein
MSQVRCEKTCRVRFRVLVAFEFGFALTEYEDEHEYDIRSRRSQNGCFRETRRRGRQREGALFRPLLATTPARLAVPFSLCRPGAVPMRGLSGRRDAVAPPSSEIERIAHVRIPARHAAPAPTGPETASRLCRRPDRELGDGPLFFRLSFVPRQRGPNQLTVDGTLMLFVLFILLVLVVLARGGDGVIDAAVCRRRCHRGRFVTTERCGIRRGRSRVRGRGGCRNGPAGYSSRQDVLEEAARGFLLLSLRRNLGLLVFVFRFAGRAPGLFDVLLDHCHDDVVGNASFTGAIVVKDVTKPRLALLH